MKVTKITGALLIGGLFAGIIVGFVIGSMVYQSHIASLQYDIDAMDALLSRDLDYLRDCAQLLSDLEEVNIQLEKDIAFLETLHDTLTMQEEVETLEEQLSLWRSVRESCREVDPALPAKVDAIMASLEMLGYWIDSIPTEDATWVDIAEYTLEGLTLQRSRENLYLKFEIAYISTIQNHIRNVIGFTEE